MDILLKRIWAKLRGKPRVDAVKAEIDQTQKTNLEQINQIAAYLPATTTTTKQTSKLKQ